MASTNVVSAVRSSLAQAIKAGDTTIQTPAKWAAAAGFSGSAASPLRKFMARDSGNGCGRNNRYGAMSAKELLGLLDDAEKFAVEKVDAKRAAKAKTIRTKLERAAKGGGQSAKVTTKATPKPSRKAKAKVQEQELAALEA